MTVRKFRYNQKTGRMAEVTLTAVARKAPHIMVDLKPYQVVGPECGKWINSRSQHREYLKKHDLIEVGNEKKYFDGRPTD